MLKYKRDVVTETKDGFLQYWLVETWTFLGICFYTRKVRAQ